MGGTSSTQNQSLSQCYDITSSKDNGKTELTKMSNYAYDKKGGDGVSTVMAIANRSKYNMEYIKQECFSGRWEQNPPNLISKGEVKGMVHRKRDGGATGSVGYVEYALLDTDGHQVCKIYFGWNTPHTGRNTVGCGWLRNGTELPQKSQREVSRQQNYEQQVDCACADFNFIVGIQIVQNNATAVLHLHVTDKVMHR